MATFNRYYQDELTYLRELSREFAQAYPALAPMLAERSGDPDVERLLEGVAFLTGRIRQKLDDEVPEVIHGIANLLFPDLLRPVASASILEITPLPNALRERLVVKKGTEFGSVPVDGTPCRFTSTFDCELIPWVIDDVKTESLGGGKQALRVEMRVPLSIPLGTLGINKLRMHVSGENRMAYGLMMWLFSHCESVSLMEPGTRPMEDKAIELGTSSLHHVGFEDDESLFPVSDTSFPGFRFLQEFYTLPQKFAFIDVEGISRVEELSPSISRFSVVFRFDAPLPSEIRPSKDLLKLHCVPVINIFPTTAEPIRLSASREQYLARPSGLAPQHGEVYAIRKAEALSQQTNTRIEVLPFYEFSHIGRGHGHPFYASHLRPSMIGDGADVYLSFGSGADASSLAEAEVVSIDLLATNRGLAGALRPGEICVATPSSPAMATFKNIGAPTPYVPTPLGKELQWRVVAHASMGLSSITDVRVLRAALDVYNLQALTDQQAQRMNELRLNALQEVKVRAAEQLYRGSPIRGVSVDITVADTGFAGPGEAFMFGAILDRIFANYVAINSFSKTIIRTTPSNMEFKWPPRNGSLTLI
jgi:type VI secretion system protein ImpG